MLQHKVMALEKQDPAQIAQFLRERREALLGNQCGILESKTAGEE
jgi:hypothetical protein